MATKTPISCTVIRRFKRRYINIETGATISDEWITGQCDAPLFTNEERKTGICRSCASGWTHPENYPVETAGRKTMQVMPTNRDEEISGAIDAGGNVHSDADPGL